MNVQSWLSAERRREILERLGRDGKVVAAYSSLTAPDDRELLGALQKQLAQHAN